MKIICKDEHLDQLEERLKDYIDLDIVLIENGMNYQGLGYVFEYQNLDQLIVYLQNLKEKEHIIGQQNERMYSVSFLDIIYIEGFSKDCYFYTKDQTYSSNLRLHEFETLLEGTSFIRISKSMIVNICYIDHIKPEVNMKYGLYMTTSIKLTLSRKYVTAFKEKIGMRR